MRAAMTSIATTRVCTTPHFAEFAAHAHTHTHTEGRRHVEGYYPVGDENLRTPRKTMETQTINTQPIHAERCRHSHTRTDSHAERH